MAAVRTSRPSAEIAQKVLVVGPSWVGDMVMAQSLFKLLADDGEDGGRVQVDVVAPPASSPVTRRMPEVSITHELAVPHGVLGLGARRRLGVSLRQHAYDRAIVLPNTFKAALVPLWARIARRTGYRGEHRYGLINDMRTLNKSRLRSTGERYCALGVDSGSSLPPPVPYPALEVNKGNCARLVSELELDSDRRVVALCPGAAFGASKRWPVRYFSELATQLTDRGYGVWVVGSPSESPLGAAIAERAPAARDLCGRTTLVDAIDLLSLADVTVSNDSGLLHVAAAVGSRIVALYGSTPPWFAPPLTDHHSVHYAGLACSPCFKRECPLEHHDCMRGLAPDEIADAVMELLDGGA